LAISAHDVAARAAGAAAMKAKAAKGNHESPADHSRPPD
jgi:hypothetical protein